MRKAFGILAAAAAMGTGLVGMAAPSNSLPFDLGLVDVSVTLTYAPASISPPGDIVTFTATVKNSSVVAATPTLNLALASGSYYRDELSTAACTGGGTAVACDVGPMASGASKSFVIAANTAPYAGGQTSTATVTAGTGLFEPLEYQGNNTATVTVPVTAPASTNTFAAGLVLRGESLSIVAGDGREYTLRVPQESPGVIVKELRTKDDGQSYTCGTTKCGNGFKLDFVQHPYYKAEDVNHPLVTLLTFGKGDPCYGLGGACASSYIQKIDNPASPLQLKPYCPGASGGSPGSGTMDPTTKLPCINHKFKAGPNQQIYQDGRTLSNDPVELSPYLQSVSVGG